MDDSFECISLLHTGLDDKSLLNLKDNPFSTKISLKIHKLMEQFVEQGSRRNESLIKVCNKFLLVVDMLKKCRILVGSWDTFFISNFSRRIYVVSKIYRSRNTAKRTTSRIMHNTRKFIKQYIQLTNYHLGRISNIGSKIKVVV